MPETGSEEWNPEIGDRRQVRLRIDSNGSATIIEPEVTKTIEFANEFEEAAGIEIETEIRIIDKSGLVTYRAEAVGRPMESETGQEDQDLPPREDLLENLRRIAADLGKTPTTHDLESHGEYDREAYLKEFDSFITALEEAKLEPTELQYRFSSHEVPEEMQGTQNVAYLREHGPSTRSELPGSVDQGDLSHGAAKFQITNNVQSCDTVYYLMDDHDPAAVLSKFLSENPNVVESNDRRTLTSLAGNHGRSFRDIASEIVEEFKE